MATQMALAWPADTGVLLKWKSIAHGSWSSTGNIIEFRIVSSQTFLDFASLDQVVGLRRSERDTSGGVVVSVWLGRH